LRSGRIVRDRRAALDARYLDAEIAARLGAPVEYRLIDDEAALLVLAARRVTLARLDGDPAACCVGSRSASWRARPPPPIWRTQSRARGNRWSTTTIMPR
jgi:hypothetical protein